MNKFKFFQKKPLLQVNGGDYIYAGEVFYTMTKFDRDSVIKPGRFIPKYTIVRRFIPKILGDKFKPDHEALWYFKTRENAEEIKELMTYMGKQIEVMKIINNIFLNDHSYLLNTDPII